MHYFLDGIEAVLRRGGHEVRRFATSSQQEIRNASEWADVVWAEFANETAAAAATLSEKPVIVRMHSYEAYGHARSVPWGRVALLIYTSEHVLDIAGATVPEILTVRRELLPSAVDTERFAFQPHGPGRRIGVVAWIRPEKNPYAWLQLLAQLPDYTLDVAGVCDFAPAARYLTHIAKRLGLGIDRLRFHGHVEDIPKFWRDKDFALSASMREGCPYNVIEAMACGVRPVIHHYLGAERQFPADCLWTTHEQAVDQLRTDIYDGKVYRAWVMERYSLAAQAPRLLRLVEEVAG